MARMNAAPPRIKAHLDDFFPLPLIRRITRELAIRHRDRCLTPAVTTYLFLRQVLDGNTAVSPLRHKAGFDFTDSAYCQARGRLPVAFFNRLARHAAGTAAASDLAPRRCWRGHRVRLIDGSSFSMPDTDELREWFGQPAGQAVGCGFPVAHLLVAVDAHTGRLLGTALAP